MKIIFTTKGTEWESAMDPRFGRTEFFLIFDEETDSTETYDNRAIENEAHGAGPKTAQKVTEYGADILITGNGPGGNAAMALQTTGIEIRVGAGDMTVREAYEAYKAGKLKKA